MEKREKMDEYKTEIGERIVERENRTPAQTSTWNSVCFFDGPSTFGPKWDAGSTSGFYVSLFVLRGPKWDKGETLWVKNVINSRK